MRSIRQLTGMLLVFCGFIGMFFSLEATGMELVGTGIGDMEVLRWQEKAPGVWSAVIGAPEEMTYLSFAGAAPKKAALKKMPAVKFPLSKEQCASHFIRYFAFESLAASLVAALWPILCSW